MKTSRCLWFLSAPLFLAGFLLADDEIPLGNWPAPPFWQPGTSGGPPETGGPLKASEISTGREALAVLSSPMPLVAIDPCRVVDTRVGSGFPGQYGPPALSTTFTRTFTVGGQCGIPVTAQAVSFQFTAVNMTSNGNFRAWPASSPMPFASVLNWTATQGVAGNGIVVPIDLSGELSVFVNGPVGHTVDLVLDVNGYYAPQGIVNSLNTLSGDVTLAEGSNVTISKVGQTLAIAAVNGGGTVQLLNTGAGLTGGPINLSGTVSVAPLGITTGMLADLAVTSAKLANGAVGLLQIDSAQVQARVTSTCPAGSTIQTINPDGSVVCAAGTVQQTGFKLSTLDSTGNVGQYTSITIGADGLGLISYYDVSNSALKVAHCSDAACTNATLSTLDSTGNAGQYTSITIGADGLGLISYYNVRNSALTVAHCSDAACTSATLSILDSTGNVGQYTSITIGLDGLGLISYHDATNGNLKVAHCSNVNCTSATLSTLDSAGDVGQYTSITIGSDGLGLISYYDVTNGHLKVAHCSNVACTSATLSTLDVAGDVGYNTSITIGSDGLGLISYYDATHGTLKAAHCSNLPCTGTARYHTDAAGTVGLHTSITIGSDGLGLISYYDVTNGDLKVAHCSDVACTSAAVNTIDSMGDVGQYTSITIGSDGLGLISYYDVTNGDLKVAHCSNAVCMPYVRRR